MDKMVLKYDNISFMQEHASEIRDYDKDGQITLTDAQICLKAALKIADSRIPKDAECEYSLKDAQELMKYALRLKKW